MTIAAHFSSRLVTLALAASVFSACRKDEPAHERSPSPVASSVSVGPNQWTVKKGGVDFLIDAPLEKIKGHSGQVRGSLRLNPDDLRATIGSIEVDLGDLATHTFDDEGKDKSQTEHAHNWLEIGKDVDAKVREENRWARFTIKEIREASASKVDDVKPSAGQRTIGITAAGDLWIHGVSSPKVVTLVAMFDGDAKKPGVVHLVSREPLALSLREHDVKPRDLAGKFLAGALEKTGQKIADVVQISFDLTASGEPQ